MLFALALGAITVGLSFNSMTETALESTYYDVVLYKKDAKVKQQLKKIAVRDKQILNYKEQTQKHGKKTPVLYISAAEINKSKFKYQQFSNKDGQRHWSTKTITNKAAANEDSEANYQLASLTPYSDAHVKVVSQAKYKQIKAQNQQSELLLVNNFRKDFNKIEKLQNMSIKQVTNTTPSGVNVLLNNSKSAQYRFVSSVASGFEFMGFFLGLAFLATLASTLMFKVLSAANSDKPRYNMLWKIGAQRQLLKASIRSEIGVLFALPAILGIIDVLFGLQFFKSMLKNPYDKIWIPFGIFLVLYLIYYLITVKLYEGIALKKK